MVRFGVELRQVRYFVAVSEELHFTRAAARLHIAQPPLSQQIRLLEKELGTPLFHRTSRHVELTPAGEAFLVEARGVLAAAESAREVAQSVGRRVSGRLVLGFVDSSLYAYLPHILSAFRAAHPTIQVRLRELPSGDQVEAISRGELQLGMVRRTPAGPEVRFEEIGREAIIVALPLGHPLAALPAIPARRLAGLPFVFPTRGNAPGLHDHLAGILHRSGVEPEIVEVASEGHTIIGLVASGVGVSIVPATLGNVSSDTVTFRPLIPTTASVGMYLAWRRGERSSAVLAFLDVTRGIRRDGLLPHHRRHRGDGGAA